jgi:hypothetical protein
MNAPIDHHGLALQRSLSDVVAEYDSKLAAMPQAMADFETAGNALKMAATIGGTYGDVTIDTGHNYVDTLKAGLLRSAWKHVYAGLNIERLASPDDKRRWKQDLEKPPAFTLDNIRGTFGRYITDPRGNILRGLAEVFCSLDPIFKSHDKMKVGVKGLPKRVIVGYVSDYNSHGKDKIESVLNALAALQGKPLVTHRELVALLNDETALLEDRELPASRYEEPVKIVGRGIRLRRYQNGNAHLYFEPATLRAVNLALAEFYGEVLADCSEDEEPARRQSTAVSRDLQYYPTPQLVVDRILDNLYHLKGARVLEPSCGCGRFMDALRKRGALAYGIEVDATRAAMTRAKGHTVLRANFLDTAPSGDFDRVIMNPPFYGKHYAKHVNHAMGFLKPGGTLTAILPISARYDHGLVDGGWDDLPVGSFSESSTNINTTVLTKTRPLAIQKEA